MVGFTTADFRDDGNLPWQRDWFTACSSIGDSSSTHSLRRKEGIGSRSQNLFDIRAITSFNSPRVRVVNSPNLHWTDIPGAFSSPMLLPDETDVFSSSSISSLMSTGFLPKKSLKLSETPSGLLMASLEGAEQSFPEDDSTSCITSWCLLRISWENSCNIQFSFLFQA